MPDAPFLSNARKSHAGDRPDAGSFALWGQKADEGRMQRYALQEGSALYVLLILRAGCPLHREK
jgi:hypothetical protein